MCTRRKWITSNLNGAIDGICKHRRALANEIPIDVARFRINTCRLEKSDCSGLSLRFISSQHATASKYNFISKYRLMAIVAYIRTVYERTELANILLRITEIVARVCKVRLSRTLQKATATTTSDRCRHTQFQTFLYCNDYDRKINYNMFLSH